ncbi:Nitrilase-like protein 2 [Bienertia sinuspersici]
MWAVNQWLTSSSITAKINSNFRTHVGSRAGESTMAANSARVAVAQMTSVNDLSVNFATCSRLVKEAAAAGAKMLCFPESFSYIGANLGDSVKIAEPLDGPLMQGYCNLARESQIWLSLGGFQEKVSDDSHLCNTHVIVDDSGKSETNIAKYIYLTWTFLVEWCTRKAALRKQDVVAVESPCGRLGLTVCYDLRFPEMYECLRFQHQAQVLLVPSAFTKITGQAHWEILLRARAIENQCYVIAAAQAGKHNEKRESYGDSLIIDPWGTVIGRLPDKLSTGIAVADLDLSYIDSVRKKLPIDKQRKPIDFWKSSSM